MLAYITALVALVALVAHVAHVAHTALITYTTAREIKPLITYIDQQCQYCYRREAR